MRWHRAEVREAGRAGSDAAPRRAVSQSGRRGFQNRFSHPCFYCELPVLLTVEPDHPGYGVVEYVIGVTSARRGGIPELQILHRFCREALGSQTNRCPMRHGLAVRRAHLGWATEQYEAGMRPQTYDRLGLRTRRPRTAGLYRRYRQILKMRYASAACRYYTGSPESWQPSRPEGTPSHHVEGSC
ncbi:hypothetical protein GTS_03650 [Gandjariella thermophila]|uniref:Uncharacterized protein n=1 Tax=Gandjariella thermophila TaxID=1931992 RepID=A0A4D4J0X4_9PSEU|nr:hypothetical protein GTS_03650 [Gandjariella thermophila]